VKDYNKVYNKNTLKSWDRNTDKEIPGARYRVSLQERHNNFVYLILKKIKKQHNYNFTIVTDSL